MNAKSVLGTVFAVMAIMTVAAVVTLALLV